MYLLVISLYYFAPLYSLFPCSIQQCKSAECPKCNMRTLYFTMTPEQLKAEQEKLDKEFERRKKKAASSSKSKNSGANPRSSKAKRYVQCMAAHMSCYGDPTGGNCPRCRDLASRGLLEEAQTDDANNPCSCPFCQEKCTFGPFKVRCIGCFFVFYFTAMIVACAFSFSCPPSNIQNLSNSLNRCLNWQILRG